MKQVDKDAYKFDSYGHVDRWGSYYYQLREIVAQKPKTVLEIGVGDAVIGNYLRSNTNIQYSTIDIAEDLHPDTVGDVRKLPFQDASFDVVCAFEVLEHLPFEDFSVAVSELHRVSRGSVLLSLPHFGPPVQFLLKLPLMSKIIPRSKIIFAFKIPFPKTHKFNGQHYWEIGKKGYSQEKIRKVLQEKFHIEKEFVPFENQYHHFFILRKKT